jgi:hypothetical protein
MKRVWQWAKRAWRGWNNVSNYVGAVCLLCQGSLWGYASIHSGHRLSYREFNQLLNQTLIQLADWFGSHF